MKRIVCLLTLLSIASSANADNWPAWRGPTGLGASQEKSLPLKWSTKENVRWKVALPAAGNSTPIIWGDRVFITQADDLTRWPPKVPANYAGGASAGGHAVAEKRSVMCFNRADGKLLWERQTIYKEPEITHPTNPFCSASPVTDGERVIASHGSAGLVCYDFEGKLLWHYDVGKIEHLWGNASSPILYGDLCILWCGPGERQFLLAVNKHTGKKVWETLLAGGDAGITTKNFLGSWATPIVARVGAEDQLVFPLPFKLTGFDLKSGKELWSAKGPGTYCYSSPLVLDGVAVYGGMLVKLGGTGDITKDRLKHKVGSMFIGTAAVSGDFLYVLNGVGVPECYEWKTGKELWKGQIGERPGNSDAWGSPVFGAGRMYITDRRGTTLVFAAGPKYEHLATNPLGEHTDASIAISGGDIFIRTHKHLWCIGESKPQKSALASPGTGSLKVTGTPVAAQDKKVDAPRPIRVLFVGNSQFYFNNLHKIVEALAESASKDRPRIHADAKPSDRAVAGGATLESHWKKGTGKDTARGKIAGEKWDFVILQDYSGVTSKESFTEHAKLFDALIRENGAKTVLFSTSHFPNRVPKGFLDVHDRHVTLGKELQVPVAAGGKAWLAYWGDNPTQEQILDLYHADKGHPGQRGSYLYACTLYPILTGHSPVGLTHRIPNQPEKTITPADARRFQEAAWQVHQEVNGKKPVRSSQPAPSPLEKYRKLEFQPKAENFAKGWQERVALEFEIINAADLRALRSALKDEDAFVRAMAARALGILVDKESADALAELVKSDKEYLVRIRAVESLGYLKMKPEAIELALKDRDGGVTWVAKLAADQLKSDVDYARQCRDAYAKGINRDDIGRAKVGQPAPDFTAQTSDGKPFKLSAVLGKKPIAIYFAAFDG